MSDAAVIFRSRVDADGLDLSADARLDGAPVLLLHGFLSTPRALGPLARRLGRDGFRVFSVAFGGIAGRVSTRRIEALAEHVQGEVERIYAKNPGLGRLVVIGHSQGGLIAAWWVKQLGGHRRVRAVVTLGTPHRGTPVAWAGILVAWLAPSLLQMLPGSGFLRRLAAAAWPAHVGLVSVFSRRDRVTPWTSARVDAAAARVRNVEVDAGHSDYLLRKGIYEAVMRELRRLAPRPVRRPAPVSRLAA